MVSSTASALAQNRGDLWDTGKVASTATFEIPYRGKHALAHFWKVQIWDQADAVSPWSALARWSAGLRPDDWKAKWIAAQPDGAAPDSQMPLLRREFRVQGRVVRAVAYVSGLGHFEFVINGQKIGNAVLAPGWTNYRKTIYYNAYDITSALRPGSNVAGVLLGNGMYNVARVPGRYTKYTGSFGQPKAIVQLRIEYADGSVAEVLSDSSWKTHGGPIVFSQVFGGEDFDARLDPVGWAEAGFDDNAWTPAIVAGGPGGVLIAQENPEIRVIEHFRPLRTTEHGAGVTVYDLGQNISGWPQITVRGRAGARLKLIPGELVDEKGLVTQRSSGGPQWFTYTLRGAAEETWSPRFSYYGFRYLQVEAEGDARIMKVESQWLHSSSAHAGEFSCSNDVLNKIHRLIVAAVRSNLQSVLTDCPHREKLGWLEESHLLGSAIMYNFDVQRLYRKIGADTRDSQLENGLVPDIAPEYTVFQDGFRDSPEWGSAAVISPWLAYRHYGDRDALATQYETMLRYVDYLGSRAKGQIISYGLGDWYDIGPKPPGVSQLTSLGVTATALYYQDLKTIEGIALLLGKNGDAERMRALAEAVRTAFNGTFLHEQHGTYDRGSQTALALPLAVGLAPEAHRATLVERLVSDVRVHRNHTTAGDVGFHYVMQALSEAGRSDVIYDLLANPEPPSYAAQIAHGATTLTEAWDADPRSSQNHFMLGHAEEWFYRYLAGIDFDLSRAPEDRITLRPTPVGDVTNARATYQSPVGVIESRWQIANERFVYDVVVPPNSVAKVLLPFGQNPRVVSSGPHHFDVPVIRRPR
jgi:hypothetical protein